MPSNHETTNGFLHCKEFVVAGGGREGQGLAGHSLVTNSLCLGEPCRDFFLGKDFDEHINIHCIGQGRSKDFVVYWEGKLREKAMHGIRFLLNCDIRALA